MDPLQSCIEMCLDKFQSKCGPIKIDREMVRSRCTMGCTGSTMDENAAQQSANMIYLRKGCKYFEKPQVVVEKPAEKPKESEKVGLLLGLMLLFVMALPPMRAAAAAVMMKNGKGDGA